MVCLSVPAGAAAQDTNPYHLNGNAKQENCNCYTLTPDEFNKSGSVWNIHKISLAEPFDYNFSVFLGCTDAQGADGIAFVLQPISTSIGAVGGGIGYDGVSPSIGVIIDTWQNFEDNDPVEDHIAIHKNGIIDHTDMDNATSPVSALPGGGNIEDCKWHFLRVIWDPATLTLRTEVDGVHRVSATIDLVRDVFQGDPMVYWGFTAATGGAKNHQRVCTSLDPKFKLPEGQLTCFPQDLQFIDSSTSFGTIEKWFWDFGDGTTSELPSPPPHRYAEPGIYDVSLKILGNNGCLSEPYTQQIVMGTKPVAGFSYPSPMCEGIPVNILDSSFVEFGTISSWSWTVGTQSFNTKDPPVQTLSGNNYLALQVSTKEGCVSDYKTEMLHTRPIPTVDFTLEDICISEPSLMQGINMDTRVGVSQWVWNFGDGIGTTGRGSSQQYRYRNGGTYQVQLTAFTGDGCPSLPVVKTIRVYETNAHAGNDTIIAENQPLMLNGSGGDLYRWTPSTGLSADDIPNPVAVLNKSTSFVLTAYTSAGCATTDTLNIKVFKGPAFYVPTAFSPNNDGKNDVLRFIAVGMKTIELFHVYNRYGQVVFSSPLVSGGWDGRLQGIQQPPGTYVWMIKGVDFTGAPHFKKGTVTLIR